MASPSSPFPLTQTDWVIVFNPKIAFPKSKLAATVEGKQTIDRERTRARAAWDDVITRLLNVGLKFQIKEWEKGRLAVFVWCPKTVLAREAYRSRVLDWLNDSGNAALEPPTFTSGQSEADVSLDLTAAERLRLVHELLTTPTYEGGAGLTMEEGVVGKTSAVGGKYIEAIFAPHDVDFETVRVVKWVKAWSKKSILSSADINMIRDYAGEKVAMYFAFLRYYFFSLAPPAAIGLLTYLLDDDYSPFFGLFMVIWGIAMIAGWNRQAARWAAEWGTRNYSKLEKVRPEFRPQSLFSDPVTGERIPQYPYWKRWITVGSVTLPITLVMGVVFFAVVGTITTSEIYFKMYYDGPGQEVLTFVPTILYAACIPALNSFYISLAHRLNDYENRLTDSDWDSSFTQKLFVFNSLLSFLPLFAVSWFFVPLSDAIGARLKSHGFIKLDSEFGPDNLSTRLSYFVLTAQVINTFTETILPMVTRKATHVVNDYRKGIKGDKDAKDEEERFEREMKKEFEQPDYRVYEDYAEMVIQFGYLALFSVAWPLAPVACFVNNFVELRSDAIKMCKTTRRAVPQRADNIGPWGFILGLISWLGSITTTSITTLYRKWNPKLPASIQATQRLPYILLFTLLAEHAYFLIRFIITSTANSVPTKGVERRRRAEFEMKKKYLLKAGIDVGNGEGGRGGGWKEGEGEGEGKVRGVGGGEGEREKAVLYGVALKVIHGVLEK
ncbi:hypothetical protein HDV00_004585 [Rhizophlyctis rosea]|nr:hypothetical protein HDV00_004585 [Rhizophlyctis rosea]